MLTAGTDRSGRASGSPPDEGPRTPLGLPALRTSHSHIFKGHARESQTPSQEVNRLAGKSCGDFTLSGSDPLLKQYHS